MLETIRSAVDLVDNTGGCVCDLFSGSGTVASFLAMDRDIIASDIQYYSSVLCEASIGHLEEKYDAAGIIESIRKSPTHSKLKEQFGELIEYEQESMNKAQSGDIEGVYDIIENGSIFIFLNEEDVNCSEELLDQLRRVKKHLLDTDGLESLDTIITRYYGGLYFSYEQAVAMDLIEHFVFEQKGLFHKKLLAALLSTASEVVNTVGKQFAQPLKVRDSKGNYKRSLKKKILEDRALDVFEIYYRWLEYYLNTGERNHHYDIICDDYKTVLRGLRDSKVKVVYADPPYTRYHYSRYYHVLETICLHDNPSITTTFSNGKGGISRAIYRAGRHQSPFCIKSQAEKAFDDLFQGVKDIPAALVLSYSPFEPGQAVTPRLQTIDQLIEKAKQYYQNVTTMSPGAFTHSKLNATDKNFEANHEAEVLIICKN